jgi:hypothetical protein
LKWTDNARNETNYTVERTTDITSPTPNWTLLTQSLAANTTGCTDNNGLRRQMKYYYRVTERNAVGNSGPRNTASITTR